MRHLFFIVNFRDFCGGKGRKKNIIYIIEQSPDSSVPLFFGGKTVNLRPISRGLLARAASSGGGGISSFSCSSFVKPVAFDTVRLRRVSSVVVVPGATKQNLFRIS